MKQANKVALVTGANREIGAAMVEALVAQGAAVMAAHYGEAERIAALVERLQAVGGTVATVDADLRQASECRRVVVATAERFGRIDLLAANAGLSLGHAFLDEDETTFDTLVDLNLKGSFFTAQAAARQMRDQGRKSGTPYRIAFTSSVTGNRAAVGMAAYAMTKAALQHLARTLAAELGGLGITVNAIAPGAIVNERNLAEDPGYAENWGRITPTGRVGQPSDIANALVFLASPEAEWVSGQTLTVDGGWTTLGYFPEPGQQ